MQHTNTHKWKYFRSMFSFRSFFSFFFSSANSVRKHLLILSFSPIVQFTTLHFIHLFHSFFLIVFLYFLFTYSFCLAACRLNSQLLHLISVCRWKQNAALVIVHFVVVFVVVISVIIKNSIKKLGSDRMGIKKTTQFMCFSFFVAVPIGRIAYSFAILLSFFRINR